MTLSWPAGPAPPDPSPAIPPPGADGARLGPWQLVEALGPGVFAGVDAGTGADVVVKVAEPTPAGAARARREAAAHRVLGGGDHPALVATAGTHDDGTTVAVATRRVPGVPLDRLVAGSGPLPFPLVAALLAPVAEALATIHDRGWVHADVSAANVVAGPAGAVLVDLGSAQRAGAGACLEATPATAAPEVLAGAPVTPAADVWSLAAVAVHAATGEPPTPGSPVPASVALVLGPALAVDPGARPTAAGLAATLRGVTRAAPATVPLPLVDDPSPPPRAERATVELAPPPVPAPPVPRPWPPWPLAVAAAAAALAAVRVGWPAG